MKKLIILIAVVLIGAQSSAQELNGWKLNGQVQLRSEVDGRDFSNRTHPLTFASLRTKLGVEKTFNEKVQLFVQFQDSRVFGEEPSTLAAIDNIDLHQGYVKLMKPFGLPVNVQAGRFEVAYGTERFIGAVGWHYVGRSFDGARFTIKPGCWDLDLFALTLDESNNYAANAYTSFSITPGTATPSSSLYGFWKKNELNKTSKFDVFGYFEIDREDVVPDTNRLELFTVGGTYWGNYGSLSTIFEGAYQFGSITGNDISAYILSLQLFYKSGITKLGLGGDMLSGNHPASTTNDYNAFQSNFGTNHKFYGYMDYFINLPSHTFNLGLNDIYVNVNIAPNDLPLIFDAVFHLFLSNQSITLDSDEQNSLGQELDLTVKYAFTENTNITWGGSLFFPGKIFKTVYDPREDAAFWTYLMITSSL